MPRADAFAFLDQIAEVSEAVYYHLQGEPLLHPDFQEISQCAAELGLVQKLTTNASHLDKYADFLLGGNFYQINFSIQSLNEVSDVERRRVMENIAEFTLKALVKCPEMYINFRYWQNSAPDVSFFAEKFGVPAEKWLPADGRYNVKVKDRLYCTFDREFQWPSEQETTRINGKYGSCYGLLDHCGVLCDGRVVPCCLDHEGALTLGDLHSDTLVNILNSEKACRIAGGFRRQERVEKICRSCGFAQRFDCEKRI